MACPAPKNAIERLGTATDGELDDAKVAEAYEALDVVRAQVAAAERSVEAYVTSKGLLPLRGDRTLTRVARKGRRVSPLALPMLKEKFPAEYPAMVRESTSLASRRLWVRLCRVRALRWYSESLRVRLGLW